MAQSACHHCLLPVTTEAAIHETVDGEERLFCCKGCQGVYHVIHDAGFQAFYAKRNDWQPGPPEEAGDIAAELVAPFIRTTEDGEQEIDLSIGGIRCASCIWLVEHFVGKTAGVTTIRVNYATHRARLRWNPALTDIRTLLRQIFSIGYHPVPFTQSDYEARLQHEKRDLLIRFASAGLLTMQLMLYTFALYAGYFQGMEPLYRTAMEVIAWGLTTPVLFYSGAPFWQSAWSGMKNRTLNMDFLIVLGSASAYFYSIIAVFVGREIYFDVTCMIISLILLGRLIEAGAKGSACDAVASLFRLQPKDARRWENGQATLVPLESLRAGDLVEILPGSSIPLDAHVVEGISEVDESMLTGESMPVTKQQGDELIGGTMNRYGRLVAQVVRTGEATVLAQIIRTVEEAQNRKAPIETVAERVVTWFTPAIVALAVLTFVGWYWSGGEFIPALMTGVAVLVISCPCALGLATPLAILVSTTSLSRRGIMVKGGDVMESAARVRHIFFDKTGTLTEGKPQLVAALSTSATLSREALITLAAAVERSSEHVLAQAIVQAVPAGRSFPQTEGFQAHPGQGVSATVEGAQVLVGKRGFLQMSGIVITQEQAEEWNAFAATGKTTVGVARSGILLGLLAIADTVRAEAASAISRLQQQGNQVVMLTGDSALVALHVGESLGIAPENCRAELSPLDKSTHIRTAKERGEYVAMVGDGINDAPALIEAHVGIAVGKATDIALESADVIFMRPDIALLPPFLRQSRRTLSIIRQNLFWAFSYNVVAIPLAVTGFIHPVISAAMMAISSLIVVGNSLRLKRS
ncbi:heavy metal translocating P-type ATPase [Chrysiogenes arsenatis]|uniref:heavy metal translocating P-type ATPase n=1 Tax=Chrysiogenes arsenatis TaxID=309797 RepID=UPI000426FF4C|nr:heavy metal translocating P-type ATPase [Chrysiogenes arsenatis]